ncbi:hypothetical protein QM600_16700 [Rhodococcus sp. IEGM 1379]|nr:hypothetical protein [Rhodococcus sp. IEGM 1379]
MTAVVHAGNSSAAAGTTKSHQHTLTPEERASLPHTYETGQFTIETLCRKTSLKQSALYTNIESARTERDADSLPAP